MKRAFLLLVTMALCIAASAQDLKPAKDKQTKKYGYQNKQKEWVIAPAFDDAKKFDDDGCALVKVDGKYGLIDLEGQWVLPADYEDIGKFDKNGLCELKVKIGKAKYYGVANRAGEVVLPVVYHKVELPKKGGCILASIEMDQPGLLGTTVWGVYSPEGKEVFPPQFLYSPSIHEGRFTAKDASTGLEGLADLDGNILLPFDFLEVSRYGDYYRTLDRTFTLAVYTANGQRGESFFQPGAVKPYDPAGDVVRTAAWHSGCIARRLYANQVRSIDIQPGTRQALCTELGIDWGAAGKRFLRLEPVVTTTVDDYAMPDPTSGNYYTLRALLYEADGTVVGSVSDRGYLEAACADGVIYNAGGNGFWFIHNDPNALALPSYSMVLHSYRAIQHDNVCNGLGLSTYDLNRLGTNVWTFVNRYKEIIEGENIGVTSYLPPVLDIHDARLQHDVMRSPVFHHVFMMGEVVNCELKHNGEETVIELHKDLVCPFEDHFERPYYTMKGEDLIWWGPHNARTVRLSLRLSPNKDALADDIAGTGRNWDIALEQFEEDGTWLRTLAVAPFADFAQDGVIVFEPLHIALLAPNAVIHRPDGPDIIKLKAPQPLPHTVSALDGFMPRHHGH